MEQQEGALPMMGKCNVNLQMGKGQGDKKRTGTCVLSSMTVRYSYWGGSGLLEN